MKNSAVAIVDTSALAKTYIREAGAESVEAYLQGFKTILASRLHILELRALLARVRRRGDFDRQYERQAWKSVQQDIADGAVSVLPLEDRHAQLAMELIEALPDISLKTLDALHLAVAKDVPDCILVTADRAMAGAARRIGLAVKAV